MKKVQILVTIVSVGLLVFSFLEYRKTADVLDSLKAEETEFVGLSSTRDVLLQRLEESKTESWSDSLSQVLAALTESGELTLVQYTPYAFDSEINDYVAIVSASTKPEECLGYEHLVRKCDVVFTYKSLDKALKVIQPLVLPIASFSINKNEKSLQLQITVPGVRDSQPEVEQEVVE